MNAIRKFVFLVLLAVWMAVPACAGPFDTCVKPQLSKITWTGTITELGDLVGAFLACDPTFSTGEAPACALNEITILEQTLGPGSTVAINCLIVYWQTHGSATQKAAAKAVGAKRGITVGSFRCGEICDGDHPCASRRL